MQNHALVVEGVLLRNAFGCNVIEHGLVQYLRAQVFQTCASDNSG